MNKQESFWNRLAKKYDKPESIEEVSQYQSIGYIKEYLKKSHILMDFGCATGTISSALAGEVQEIHGVDISPQMIEIAKQRAVDRNLDNIHFFSSDIMENQFRKEHYDMVITFSVLHLLEEKEKIIHRINELLKPGAWFISLTPCLGEKKFLSGFMRFLKTINVLPSITCYKIPELEDLIKTNGFLIEKSISLEGNPLEHFIIAQKS